MARLMHAHIGHHISNIALADLIDPTYEGYLNFSSAHYCHDLPLFVVVINGKRVRTIVQAFKKKFT